MLLPVAPGNEEDAVEAAAFELSRLSVDPADHATWLRVECDQWRDDGEPGDDLTNVTAVYLETGDPERGNELAGHYFGLHRQLREQGFSHDDAAAFLSHARLMAHLAERERMSSAQIARALSARDERVQFSWRAVRGVLRALHMAPRLDQDAVEQLYERDVELEQVVFADADLVTCATMLEDAAARLGFPQAVAPIALTLYGPDGRTFGPYLQLLHFLCVVAEFYDHAISTLYEFAPRGNVARWLFDKYPASLTSSGNPALNNAKGLDQLTQNWAASRKSGEAEQARALVALVSGMESMGFVARQELAGWLRRWLIRLIRLAKPLTRPLPLSLSTAQGSRLLDEVAAGETNTKGIIEQRVVDALSSCIHGSDWRSRGLGDPVNASNVSRRKLGDCDYQNAQAREIVAYEAHAGRLTDVYLKEHRRTLHKMLVLRREELEGVSDPSEWEIRVIFVAHDLDADLPCRYEEDGIGVLIEHQSFADLARSVRESDLLGEALDRHIIVPLSEKRTPAQARECLLALIE
jgi:hypothetical protein